MTLMNDQLKDFRQSYALDVSDIFLQINHNDSRFEAHFFVCNLKQKTNKQTIQINPFNVLTDKNVCW